LHKGGRVLEALALFDAGSRRSYFSKDFAEKIGYEPYEKPREVLLAAKGLIAEPSGRWVCMQCLGMLRPASRTSPDGFATSSYILAYMRAQQ
jgi:hypothetical protein